MLIALAILFFLAADGAPLSRRPDGVQEDKEQMVPEWVRTAYPVDGAEAWAPEPGDQPKILGIPDFRSAITSNSDMISIPIRLAVPLPSTPMVPLCTCRFERISFYKIAKWIGRNAELTSTTSISVKSVTNAESVCRQTCVADGVASALEVGGVVRTFLSGDRMTDSSGFITSDDGTGEWLIVERESWPEGPNRKLEGLKNCTVHSTVCIETGKIYHVMMDLVPEDPCPFDLKYPDTCLVKHEGNKTRLICAQLELSLDGGFYEQKTCGGNDYVLFTSIHSAVVAYEVPTGKFDVDPRLYASLAKMRLRRLGSLPRLGDSAPAQIIKMIQQSTSSNEYRILSLEAQVTALTASLKQVKADSASLVRGSYVMDLGLAGPSLVRFGPGYMAVQRLKKVTNIAFASSSTFDRWPIKFHDGKMVKFGFLDLNTLVIEPDASEVGRLDMALLKVNSTHACDLVRGCHVYYPLMQPVSGRWGALGRDLTIGVDSYHSAALSEVQYKWSLATKMLDIKSGVIINAENKLATELAHSFVEQGFWAMWRMLPWWKWLVVGGVVSALVLAVFLYFAAGIMMRKAMVATARFALRVKRGKKARKQNKRNRREEQEEEDGSEVMTLVPVRRSALKRKAAPGCEASSEL